MPHPLKRFYVRVELLLHAVTCPGVWLCSHGYLELTIKTLGYYFRTGAMEPRFPLLCHDQFHMEGYFKSVDSLGELEQVLATEQLEITLWQNGRRLAYFMGKLSDVMQPSVPRLSCAHSGNVQLLLRATSAFPGIIAPKVELSIEVTMQDKHKQQHRPHTGNCYCKAATPTPKSSNQNHKQYPVCHSKQLANCSSFSNSTTTTPTGSEERRLSTCSSLLSSSTNSQALSSSLNSTFTRCSSHSTVDCTARDTEEHQNKCEICQAYRRVFGG